MKNVLRVTSKFAPAETERSVRFVLSTSAADRVGDTIDPHGWHLANYKKNPIVLWSHDRYMPPIGKMHSIRVSNGELVGDIEFATAEQHPFADTVYQLVKGEFISAGSVGFAPIRWELNSDGGIDFKEQELLEYSIVTVPCNPDAARKMCELVGSDAAEPFLKFMQEPGESYALARKSLLALPQAKPIEGNARSRLRTAEIAAAELQLNEVF